MINHRITLSVKAASVFKVKNLIIFDVILEFITLDFLWREKQSKALKFIIICSKYSLCEDEQDSENDIWTLCVEWRENIVYRVQRSWKAFDEKLWTQINSEWTYITLAWNILCNLQS